MKKFQVSLACPISITVNAKDEVEAEEKARLAFRSKPKDMHWTEYLESSESTLVVIDCVCIGEK